MKINEIFKKLRNESNKAVIEEKLIEHGAEKVQATLDQIEGEQAYDEATKTAIQEIKKHPELAMKILATINENVSSQVVVNTVIQLPNEDVFSEKTAVKATEQLELNDEYKVTIIEESSLGYKNKMKIAKQLEDKEIRTKIQKDLRVKEEQRALDKLEKVYKMCNEEINEIQLKDEIDRTMKSIHIDTDAIQEKKNRIIARKIAYNYATYGTNIVSKQRLLMSPKMMYEIDIIQMAKEEYEKIMNEYESIRGQRIREFNEQELNYNILKEIEATSMLEEFDEETAFKEIKNMIRLLPVDERKKAIQAFKSVLEKRTKKVQETEER